MRLGDGDDTPLIHVGIIQYYGWREVTAVYTDDDFGNNGVNALGTALKAAGSSLVNKVSLDPTITSDGVGQALTQLSQLESRVLVVHMEPKLGRMLFVMAQWLQMVSEEYVWIVTEAMTSIMDDLETDSAFRDSLQGVIGTRSYIPSSPELQGYKDRWTEYYANDSSLGPAQMNNVYAWYAYDAVWVVAHALRNFTAQGGNITFVAPPVYPSDAGGNSELAEIPVFRDGKLLLQSIVASNVTGITGLLELNARGDFVGTSFEVVNMVGKGLRSVGFWSNDTGCLPFAPVGNSSTVSSSGLQTVIWPGGVTDVPRGWVVPKAGKTLIIGVPNRIGYKEFLSSSTDSENRTTYHGFCIDVFQRALEYLPYSLAYNFTKYGNGSSTPSYDALVQKIVKKVPPFSTPRILMLQKLSKSSLASMSAIN